MPKGQEYANILGSSVTDTDEFLIFIDQGGGSFGTRNITRAELLAALGAAKNNLAASAKPTATDDSASGYAVGSRWLVTSGPDIDKEFLCFDATTGAAVWVETTGGSSSPTTTKGDLIARDATQDVRVAVGADGQVLTADSASAAGVKWANASAGGGGGQAGLAQAAATLVEDTFTDTNGTAIASHTPETDSVGSGWTLVKILTTATLGTATVQSNEAEFNADDNAVVIDAGKADVAFSFDVVFPASGSNMRARCPVRYESDGNMFIIEADKDGGTLKILDITSDTVTTLDTATFTFAVSTTYTVKAVCQGGQIDVYIDGVLKASAFSSKHLAGKKFGIGRGNPGATTLHLDHVLITDVDPTISRYDPSSDPDVEGWYAADKITGLVDGNGISSWPNSKSGGGLGALAQATGSLQPLYKTNILNSLPIVRFDGVDDLLQTTTVPASLKNDTDKTLIIIGTVPNAASKAWLWLGGATVARGNFGLATGAASNEIEGSQWADDLLNTGIKYAYNKPQFIAFIKNGLGLKLIRDQQAAMDASSAAGAITTNSLILGARANNSGATTFTGYSAVDIAEVIILKSAPTNRKLLDIMQYVSDKWGV